MHALSAIVSRHFRSGHSGHGKSKLEKYSGREESGSTLVRVRVHAPSSETQGRDDAIYSGESLLQEQTSPWAHILTEPVPEVSRIPSR